MLCQRVVAGRRAWRVESWRLVPDLPDHTVASLRSERSQAQRRGSAQPPGLTPPCFALGLAGLAGLVLRGGAGTVLVPTGTCTRGYLTVTRMTGGLFRAANFTWEYTPLRSLIDLHIASLIDLHDVTKVISSDS